MCNSCNRLTATPPAPAGRLSHSGAWALAGLSLPMLMSSLDTSIANVALPTLAREFGASFQGVQWVVLAYLLAITTLIVSVGRLGDMVGRRRLLLAGIALFTLASLACGVAPTLGLLIAARAAQGLGAAIMMALSLAFVGETVPPERIGRTMGLLGTMSAVGTALGPALGGLLIVTAGWRSIFLVNLPVGLLTLFLAQRFLPADSRGARAEAVRFDLPGTLLLAATLAAYALAMTAEQGRFGPFTLLLLLAAAAGLALFARVESRAAAPLVPLARLRHAGLRAGLAMSLLVSTVMMSTLVVGPFYLGLGLGLRPTLVGLLLSIGPIIVALSGLPAGRAVDRFGAAPMTRAGLLGLGAGALLLAALPATLGLAGYLPGLALITASYALFQAANNSAVMIGLPPGQRGVISGLLNLSRNLGLITGASVLGAVFALGAGTSDLAHADPAAVARGMRITFAVAAGLMLVALRLAPARRADEAANEEAPRPAVEGLPLLKHVAGYRPGSSVHTGMRPGV